MEVYQYTSDIRELLGVIDTVKNIEYFRTPKHFLLYPKMAEIMIFRDCEKKVNCGELPATVRTLKLINSSFKHLDLEQLPNLQELVVEEGTKTRFLAESHIIGWEACNLKNIDITTTDKTFYVFLAILQIIPTLENISLKCHNTMVYGNKIYASPNLQNVDVDMVCCDDVDWSACRRLKTLRINLRDHTQKVEVVKNQIDQIQSIEYAHIKVWSWQKPYLTEHILKKSKGNISWRVDIQDESMS